MAKRLVCWFVLGCWLTIAAGREAHAATVWEHTPYRVDIWVAIDPATGDGEALFNDVSGSLATLIDRLIGGAWVAQVQPAPPPLAQAALVDLEHLAADVWPEHAPATADPSAESPTAQASRDEPPAAASPVDKQIVLTIGRFASGWQLAAREHDLATGITGRTERRAVSRRSELNEAAFRAVLDCFAPLARIEAVDGKSVSLLWRAGKLPHRDPGLQLVHPRDLLLPVIREFDRSGQARRVQPLDWTFVRVDDSEALPDRGTLFSGLRSPLGRRRRGRTEQLAIVVRPPDGSTRLELCSRTQTDRPLVGYEVFAHAPDSPATRLLGTTDGRGHLQIDSVADDPLQILIVKHGQEFLARLPIVPGLFAVQRAPVIDDDLRMAVEGYVIGMQEQLVDTIVRRKILLARLRMRIEDGRAAEAQPLMDELRKLETPERFLNELTSRQRATVADDPVSAGKINKLFAETRDAIVRYLDPDEIDAAERQLAAALAETSAPEPAPTPAPPAEPAAPPSTAPPPSPEAPATGATAGAS
ncbi:MAG: hypothetical protein AB7U73_06225 [Pirellulales bacterium]